ncbi:MAG TPA: hypothetical protein DHW40_12380 [Microbacterium sp.]|nr:hypothetical protein [Microbacterium sp.]
MPFDDTAVRALLARIDQDDSHTNVRTVVESPTEQRDFPEWTMGYKPITTPTDAAPEGFRDTFDDLESHDDPGATLRAARELSLWFRVRAQRARTGE